MERVYISKIMSADLKSRSSVQILCDILKDRSPRNTIIDFQGVNFATRSFVDEFYNVFIKQMNYQVVNLPKDIEFMLNVVQHTQNKEKIISYSDNVKTFSSIDDFCEYLSILAF